MPKKDRSSCETTHLSDYSYGYTWEQRRGLPIMRLILHHSTRVNLRVRKCGKDSFRQIMKSLSPSNSGLQHHLHFKTLQIYKLYYDLENGTRDGTVTVLLITNCYLTASKNQEWKTYCKRQPIYTLLLL